MSGHMRAVHDGSGWVRRALGESRAVSHTLVLLPSLDPAVCGSGRVSCPLWVPFLIGKTVMLPINLSGWWEQPCTFET